jgi:peptidoglycan hydrolase CwlO-like protein
MIKALLGVIGVLILMLAGAMVYSRHENKKLDQISIQYQNAQQDINDLNKALENRAEMAKTTDKIITDVAKNANETKTQIDEIKNKVITTAKKEDKGEVNPSVASSVYLDSMWQVYCKTGYTNSHCPTK